MANGSRRTTPCCPNAAAVVSDPIVAAMYTPKAQLKLCTMSGIVPDGRPPKTKALTGTPLGSSQSGSSAGFCVAGAVKRALGCDALVPDSGVQSLPCQSMACAGGSPSMPSHQTSPSSVSATLVKIVLARIDSMADGLVENAVPGATPKYPASGLIAYSLPSAPGLIQAMSSPTVVTFHPSSANAGGGTSIAKLVLPQALGKAAAT